MTLENILRHRCTCHLYVFVLSFVKTVLRQQLIKPDAGEWGPLERWALKKWCGEVLELLNSVLNGASYGRFTQAQGHRPYGPRGPLGTQRHRPTVRWGFASLSVDPLQQVDCTFNDQLKDSTRTRCHISYERPDRFLICYGANIGPCG